MFEISSTVYDGSSTRQAEDSIAFEHGESLKVRRDNGFYPVVCEVYLDGITSKMGKCFKIRRLLVWI